MICKQSVKSQCTSVSTSLLAWFSRPSRSALTAYLFALPGIGSLLMFGPVGLVMSGLYAKEYGISLMALGSAMVLVRISDAITDPLIGWLTDRQQVKSGSRKSLIIIGVAILLLSAAAIIFPVGEVTVWYITLWCMMYYIGLTCFTTAREAWAHEITATSEEKILLFSRAPFFATIGRLAFYLLPFLPIFATSAMTSEVLQLAFWVGAPLFLVSVALLLFVVPSGKTTVAAATPAAPSHSQHAHSQYGSEEDALLPSLSRRVASGVLAIKACIAGLAGNGLFVRFVLCKLLYWFGMGMSGGLLFIYSDVFLHLGEQYASTMFLGIGCSLVSFLLWQRLSNYIDKITIFCLCSLAATAPFILVLFMQPGATWSLYGLYALFVIQQTAYAGIMVVSNPILCDVIDYGRLKDPAERTGQYFAVSGFLLKIEAGLATGLGMMMVGWFGFDAQASEQTESAIFGLHLTMAYIPLILGVVAMWLMWSMPLREHRVTIIRKRLKQRQERGERAMRQLDSQTSVNTRASSNR